MKLFIVFTVIVASAFARPGFLGSPIAYSVAAPAATITAYSVPVEVASQYHAQDTLGQYNYGYSSSLSSKAEARSLNGITQGAYNYIDANGQLQSVQYTADAVNGFRVAATNLPTPPAVPDVPAPEPPKPVEDTPEVAQARAAHLAAIEETKARNAAAAAEEANAAQAAQAAAKIAAETQSVQVNTIEAVASPVAYSVAAVPAVHAVPAVSAVPAVATVPAVSTYAVGVPTTNAFAYSYKTIQPSAYTFASHQYLSPYAAIAPLTSYAVSPIAPVAAVAPVSSGATSDQSATGAAAADNSDSVEITAARSAKSD